MTMNWAKARASTALRRTARLFASVMVVVASIVAAPSAWAQLPDLIPASAPASVTHVRIAADGAGGVVLMADMSEALDHHIFTLRAHDRIVIDLPALAFALGDADRDVSAAPGVDGLRYGQFSRDRSRIVIDLAGEPLDLAATVLETSEGGRLLVRFRLPGASDAEAGDGAAPEHAVEDVVDADAPVEEVAGAAEASGDFATGSIPTDPIEPDPAPEADAGPSSDAGSPAAPERRLAPETAPPAVEPSALAPLEGERPARRPEPLMIAIDAGHGGRDGGATHGGVEEADVVLAFARTFQGVLEQPGRIHVVLIRDADVFVELDERVERARAIGADLFISIHADAVENHRDLASGTSVYTLSDEASGALAAEYAALAGGGAGDIALDFRRRWLLYASDALAQEMLGALDAEGLPVLGSRPHRHEDFRVLRNFDAPSVLVELGFMTHPEDRARLVDAEWRAQVARILARAVRRWAAQDAAAPAHARRAVAD